MDPLYASRHRQPRVQPMGILEGSGWCSLRRRKRGKPHDLQERCEGKRHWAGKRRNSQLASLPEQRQRVYDVTYLALGEL
jgi:hypothetical protein